MYESIPLDVHLYLVSGSLSHELGEVVTLCFTCSYRLGITALLNVSIPVKCSMDVVYSSF